MGRLITIDFAWPESVPLDHIDRDFIQGMLDRMATGFFNHGHFRRQANRPDFIKCLQIRMDTYHRTGNTENLMDAANFLMGEFMFPGHSQAYFRPTRADDAPGVHCGGMTVKAARMGHHVRQVEGD